MKISKISSEHAPELLPYSIEKFSELVKKQFSIQDVKLLYQAAAVNQGKMVEPRHNSHPHGFVATVLTAYYNHLPLILSPDDFWLLVSLAINQLHLASTGKMHKPYKGTQFYMNVSVHGNIISKVDHIEQETWEEYIVELWEMVKLTKNKQLADILYCSFSTSEQAQCMALGAAYTNGAKHCAAKHKIVLHGAIPHIILLGTANDYTLIIDRILKLLRLLPQFDNYLLKVLNHMEKIYETIALPDGLWKQKEFWNGMVFHTAACTTTVGWITDFICPCEMPRAHKKKSSLFNHTIVNDTEFGDYNAPAMNTMDFVLENSMNKHKKSVNMKLVAGFVGVTLDEASDAVKPAIGWIVYRCKTRKFLRLLSCRGLSIKHGTTDKDPS